jgi:primosomal protein N' (replication factor Y)
VSVFVEIVVNVPQVSGVYHYHLPPELEGAVQVGSLVLVPFGRQAVQGVVVDFVDHPSVRETKAIIEIVDAAAILTPHQIALARRMAQDYLAPLAACIGLMLPPGVEQQADYLYSAQSPPLEGLSHTQARLLSLLNRRGPLRGSQIDRAMPRVDWRAAARALARRRLIKTEPAPPTPRVRPKLIKTVQLVCAPDEAEAALPTLGKAGSKALERRQSILRFLLRESEAVDVSWVYAESGGSLADLRYLAERGLVRLEDDEAWRNPLAQLEFRPYHAPPLTQDQQEVWGQVERALQQAANGEEVRPILLNGVTGSGKTEIYLHAVQHALEMGKQAIVLVPEIALTPQTLQRFAGRFPGQVGLVHSGLSSGERYDTWRRARAGDLGVVVGPRSALFTPFNRLGLIVVDECHDDSYYQSEAAPHFHAREVAVSYAALCGALCLLGSATPDVVSAHRAEIGLWQSLSLPARILAHRDAVQAQVKRLELQKQRIAAQQARYRTLEAEAETADLPPVTIVDMRNELKEGNRSIFSRFLQESLKLALEQGLQAILFLNRRGSATYVFCRDCGHTLKCPRCDIPLTYHEDRGKLICHYCNYQRQMPAVCPACGGERIRQFGAGTQRVEAEVQSMFPGVRTLRWDWETTRQKGAHQAILDRFAEHRADVLIGTQMLAKGLDLPLVTLVGVVLADVGLNHPDYRAGERTFQVLTQVAGRAGRSPLGGQVILQTFQPEHYVIQAAARHDYRGFYRRELAFRRQQGYPPFANVARLEYRHYDPERAAQAAQIMAERLHTWIEQEGARLTRLVGPAPCFFARIAGAYRWQIALIGPDPAALLRGRDLGEWKVEVNPPNLL